MRRYFLHLRDHTEELLDPDGIECAGTEALHKAVLVNARDTIAGAIETSGVLDLRYRIDAEDESGTVVHSLSFARAVNIIPETAA